MPTGNPLEQFRRRMQSHATPAAFAALAEEHRRAGRLDEAIAVCRDGLARYPAYVSARVTLGRALLDAGDVAAALEELGLAVAQAPDNFAAVRALEAAHAATGGLPPQEGEAAQDLTLHGHPLDDDAGAIPADLVARALGTGVDGPQEFGLGPDWSLPDAPQVPAEVTWPAPDAVEPLEVVSDPETAVAVAHADAPTMVVTSPYLQGDEPAGIWPVPADLTVADPITDAAPVFSWALDPPAGSEAAPPHQVAEVPPPPSVWDAPTIEAPLVGVQVGELPASAFVAAPAFEAGAAGGTAVDTPAAESFLVSLDAPGEAPASVADESSGFWSDFAAVGGGAADPVPFAGWGDTPAPAAASAAASPWGDEDATGQWVAQDGPSAAWALPGPDEASPTPFQDVLAQPTEKPVPAGFALGEASGVDPVPFAGAEAPPRPASPWSGSLASALDEVFSHAGQPMPAVEPRTDEGADVRHVMADVAVEAALSEASVSFEPPTSEITAVRMAMADAAVEAAMEDVGQVEPPPVLASLEEMLAAVRARRASLFSNLPS